MALEVLWPNESVTSASVKRAIRGARQLLGDDGDSQSSIRTLRGRGYQLLLPVHPVQDAGLSPPPAPPPQDLFVGRRGVVAMLEASMQEALGGRGGLLLLVGEPALNSYLPGIGSFLFGGSDSFAQEAARIISAISDAKKEIMEKIVDQVRVTDTTTFEGIQTQVQAAIMNGSNDEAPTTRDNSMTPLAST